MNIIMKTVSRNYNVGLSPIRNIHITKVQYLYSQSALGVDSYLISRKNIKEQFAQFSENFKAKMNDFVQNPKHMIFTEDLKNMVHMAEPSDLNLVLDMVKKFNTQKTEFRFGSFVFGPVVMRMFYFLDAPVDAIKSFEDPANEGFFDQLITYQILLDLLYNHAMYEEMYKIFDKIQERQLNMTKYPKYPVVLVLAACYKQNTAQSYEYAKKLWNEMMQVGSVPLRRACTLMAALALKNNEPHVALECVALQTPHYVTIRNIKVMALSKIERIDDALPILRGVLDVDSPRMEKHTFFEETISTVKEAVNKSSNKDYVKQFADIQKALRDRGLIDNQTLDKLVTSEIILSPKAKNPAKGMPRMPYGQRQKRNIS
ncbi:pentatricopeptide repeat-containing protein 2, mitochondrial-like [Colias croceus]|uniref:pentatricopeptide repeat-containing protein 2, mitochondrial-like n=1 Tax=Colias crocea TaxID=72248 RepID=UPI001E28032F|nr:pentatricopeptide repeat-containing protein 2, mitochondrial-like [Colias croceus]